MKADSVGAEQTGRVRACGTPGPVRDWGSGGDVWARSRIDEYDFGLLSDWHVQNCRQVTPQFFGLLGRVMFGAATSAEVDMWLSSVETSGQDGAVGDPLTIDALLRVRRGSCRYQAQCRCAEFRDRAYDVLRSLNALPASELIEQGEQSLADRLTRSSYEKN